MTTLCKLHGITPSQYYQWPNDLFSGALYRDGSLHRSRKTKDSKAAERKNLLQKKITDQKDVIAEILYDHYALISLGELKDVSAQTIVFACRL